MSIYYVKCELCGSELAIYDDSTYDIDKMDHYLCNDCAEKTENEGWVDWL